MRDSSYCREALRALLKQLPAARTTSSGPSLCWLAMTDARVVTPTRRTGILLAGVTAVISGFAVFINSYGVRAWAEVSDPTTYTTLKNLVAAVALTGAAAVITRRRSSEGLTRPHRRTQWLGLAVVAVVGGSIPFVLFFEGLARASSSQAAFIHKTLVIWVAILAVGMLGEKISAPHVVAIGLLVWGQAVLVGGVSDLLFGVGELMMLAATLLWSVEIIVAKVLLKDVSSLTVGVTRMAGGVAVLLAYSVARGAFAEITGLTLTHVVWILVTGAVLAGYVGSWYAALARAQAIDVTAVLVGGALITASLQLAVRGVSLPSSIGLGLVTAGVVLVIALNLRRPRGLIPDTP